MEKEGIVGYSVLCIYSLLSILCIQKMYTIYSVYNLYSIFFFSSCNIMWHSNNQRNWKNKHRIHNLCQNELKK